MRQLSTCTCTLHDSLFSYAVFFALYFVAVHKLWTHNTSVIAHSRLAIILYSSARDIILYNVFDYNYS